MREFTNVLFGFWSETMIFEELSCGFASCGSLWWSSDIEGKLQFVPQESHPRGKMENRSRNALARR